MRVESLENRPRLTRWTRGYWDDYQVLSGSRIVHQGGIGPIPISEMVAYMDATYLVDADERLKFIRMMQSLDRIYVKHINDQAKQKADKRAKARQAKAPRKR